MTRSKKFYFSLFATVAILIVSCLAVLNTNNSASATSAQEEVYLSNNGLYDEYTDSKD